MPTLQKEASARAKTRPPRKGRCRRVNSHRENFLSRAEGPPCYDPIPSEAKECFYAGPSDRRRANSILPCAERNLIKLTVPIVIFLVRPFSFRPCPCPSEILKKKISFRLEMENRLEKLEQTFVSTHG